MTYLGLGEAAGKASTGCAARENSQSVEPAHWYIPAAAAGFWGLLVVRGLGTEQGHLQAGVGNWYNLEAPAQLTGALLPQGFPGAWGLVGLNQQSSGCQSRALL